MKIALSVIGAALALSGVAMAQSASEWTGHVRLGGVVSQSSGAGAAVRLGGEFFEDPAKASPLAYRQLYETAGFLGGKYESYGAIVEGESVGQKSFSANDVVYINRTQSDGLRMGDKYFAFHSEDDEVIHPVSEKPLGRKVFIDGVIEVIEQGQKFSRARIIRSYNAIREGYRIRQYEETKLPSSDMDKPVTAKNVTGLVVASKDMKSNYGIGDVVYLDVGKKSGVETGDLFELIALSQSAGDKDATPTPDKVVGKARALRVEDDTATVIVISSIQAARLGYAARYISEREVLSPVVMKSGKK